MIIIGNGADTGRNVDKGSKENGLSCNDARIEAYLHSLPFTTPA